jgi:hypothetical protein
MVPGANAGVTATFMQDDRIVGMHLNPIDDKRPFQRGSIPSIERHVRPVAASIIALARSGRA